MELRPYQLEALQAINESPSLRQLISLPTGTGKTVIFAELLRQRNHRSLVLVHRDELVRQAVAKCEQAGLTFNLGVVKANLDEVQQDIVIASVQTLSRDKRLVHYLRYGAPNTVIVDEAHHAPAPTYRKVLAHVGKALVVGFTATPDRKTESTDGKHVSLTAGMASVFDSLTYYRSLTDMIGEGWLVDVMPATVKANISLHSVPTSNNDWQEGALGEALQKAHAEVTIVQACQQAARNRPTLAFFPTVESSKQACRQFQAEAVTAEHVDGTTPIETRQAIYQRLRNGDTQVITNCMVLTEGFDEPAVSCIIVARPTKSRSLFAQMIGRGTRLYPGKDNCLVFSVVSHELDIHPVTLQTFLNDPGWTDHQTLSARKKVIAASHELDKKEQLEAIKFTQTFRATSSAKFIWAKTGNRWRLRLGTHEIILKETNNGLYAIMDTATPLHPLAPSPLPLDGAVRIAETYAIKHNETRLVDPNAAWRGELPTAKQLKFAHKLGIHTEGMSRGEVSEAIDRALTK